MSDSVSSAPTGSVADVSAQAPTEAATSTQQDGPLKVKVDGQEREVTKEQLLKDYELREASYKRMQAAAAQEKKFADFERQLNDDPLKFLESKNPQIRDLTEKWLAQKIQEDMMSPEERQKRELELQLQEYKKRDAEAEEKRKADAASREEQAAAASIEGDIQKVLTEMPNLPRTPYTVKRIAHKMLAMAQSGVDISAKEAAELITNDDFNDIRSHSKDLTGDQLMSILGEDIVNKIRKADLGRLKSNPASARPDKVASPSTPRKQAASKMSKDEFYEYLKNKRS